MPLECLPYMKRYFAHSSSSTHCDCRHTASHMNDLRSRLHWLMGLRVTFVTLMLGLSLIFQVTKGERVETFYALIILTYIADYPFGSLAPNP